MNPNEQPPDYGRAAVVAGLTVVIAVILFFVLKSVLSFILEHWLLTLFCVLIGVGAALFFLVRGDH